MLFRVAECFGADELDGEPATLSPAVFQRADFVAVGGVVECQPCGGKAAVFGLCDKPLCQRVVVAVEVGVARAARQFVASQGNAVRDAGRQLVQGEAVFIETGAAAQFGTADVKQHPFVTAAAVGGADAQFFLYFFVEVFQHDLPGFVHGFVDFAGEVLPQSGKACLDFFGGTAAAVDVGDAPLEVHAGAYRAQHFVAGAEDAFKELEFFLQQFVHARVGFVATINEVHHDDVVFLPVAVAAADALLNALRVPRQVVVDDERAELQVDAFCARFGGNHDGAALFEMFN